MSIFCCYKQDTVLFYIAVGTQAMSLLVDGINMNRILAVVVVAAAAVPVPFMYIEAVPHIVKETFQIMYIE